jgi:hypothetical protein
MASREEREGQAEARALLYRRLMYAGLLLVAIGVAVWFVRWVSGGLGMDKIGEHYKQAETMGP